MLCIMLYIRLYIYCVEYCAGYHTVYYAMYYAIYVLCYVLCYILGYICIVLCIVLCIMLYAYQKLPLHLPELASARFFHLYRKTPLLSCPRDVKIEETPTLPIQKINIHLIISDFDSAILVSRCAISSLVAKMEVLS